MSVNVGATVSNAVTLTPSPETMTLTPISLGVTGVTNDAVDVTAGIDSMALSSLSATIGSNVIVQPGFGSMALTAQAPSVDYTPVQGDVNVDVGSQTMTLTASNAVVLFDQGQADDFIARATASTNVLYATNFDDVYLAGVKDVGRSGIASTAELIAEAHSTPGDDQLAFDSSQRLSGAGSLQMYREGADAGQTVASWVFKTNGDQSGLISQGTSYPRQYFQFSVRFDRAALAWRSKGDSSPKVWKAHNDGFEDGEVLIINRREMGFVSCQMNNPTEGLARILASSPGDAFLGDVRFYQNNVYPSGGIDSLTAEQAITLAGPLADQDGSSGREFGTAAGNYGYTLGDEYLDARASVVANGGFPNSWAATNGVPWAVDGWTTVTVFVDFSTSRTMIWAAPYGSSPKLVIDDTGTLKIPTGTYAHVHQIVWQKTSQEAETGVRPTSYRWYDEVITSTDPISFPNPGGVPYALPGNLGGLNATNLEVAMNGLTSGSNDTYADTSLIGTSQPWLAWQTEFHHYVDGEVLDVFGKRNNNDTTWEHHQFDLNTEVWTNKTSNGSNSPTTWDTSGHIYGHSTIDQATGDLYILIGNPGFIYRYNRSSDTWESIAKGSWTTTSQKDGMAWHPNLYGTDAGGLVVATAGTIWVWRKSTTTWTVLTSSVGQTGSKEGIGIYHPVSDAVFVKGSNTSGNPIVMVTSGPAFQEMGNPPIAAKGGGSDIQSGDHMTVLPHPDGTSKLIGIENYDDTDQQSRAWVSSDNAATWSSISAHGLNVTQTNGGGPFQQMFGGIMCVSVVENRIWKP